MRQWRTTKQILIYFVQPKPIRIHILYIAPYAKCLWRNITEGEVNRDHHVARFSGVGARDKHQ